MNAHTPIPTCEYETTVKREGRDIVLISCPITSDETQPCIKITFTPDEAETVGADLIEAARGRARRQG